MSTVRVEPSGYHACSVVWTHDSWHDGGPVDGDWTHEGVSTGLVIFEKFFCIYFDRPQWIRIAKVALNYIYLHFISIFSFDRFLMLSFRYLYVFYNIFI